MNNIIGIIENINSSKQTQENYLTEQRNNTGLDL